MSYWFKLLLWTLTLCILKISNSWNKNVIYSYLTRNRISKQHTIKSFPTLTTFQKDFHGLFPLSLPASVSALDDDMILSINVKIIEIFDLCKKCNKELNKSNIFNWENKLKALASELQLFHNQDILLKMYSIILTKAATIQLDPLQLTTFHILINALSDVFIQIYPKNTAITSLIDEITEVHLNFIESFQGLLDTSTTSRFEIESDNISNEEYLCYQFAELCRYMYSRLSTSLGTDFDTSTDSQQMRVTNWVSPIYARLQRRFVRFVASQVDEKVEEMNNNAFERLIDRLKIEISPRYHLHNKIHSSINPINDIHSTDSSSSSSTGTITVVESDNIREYPSWELANFIVKILRNSVGSTDLAGLEFKVNRMFRNDLSSRMQALGRPLEELYDNRERLFYHLSPVQIDLVEDMLNLGHESVSAVLTIWQIRYNIVGVPNQDGVLVKSFLYPITLYHTDGGEKKSSSVLESIPKELSANARFAVEDLSVNIKPSNILQSAGLLAYAIRATASDELRALSTYNIDVDEQPVNRDGVYISVLVAFLVDVLLQPSIQDYYLYENLLAFVALEETIGVREPRSACVEAYTTALSIAALRLISTTTKESNSSVNDVLVSKMKSRVNNIERALVMILRFPEEDSEQVRWQAYKGSIDYVIRTSDEQGLNGLQEVEKQYVQLADIMNANIKAAKNYIMPLGQARFDKTVGGLLLNADLAISMPELGATFENQVMKMAEDLLISPEEAERRIIYLAGAVCSSFLEISFEESQKMNYIRTDLLICKAYTMYKHPLLIRLQAKDVNKDIREVGLRMSIAKLGNMFIMDLIRVLESARQRLSDSSSSNIPSSTSSSIAAAAITSSTTSAGWGSSLMESPPSTSNSNNNAELIAFIQFMQTFLLKEYTTLSSNRIIRKS